MTKEAKKGKKPGKKTQGKKVRQKNAQTKTRKSIRPSRVFVYALAIAALGGGGYLAYDRLKRKKFSENASESNADTIIVNNSLPASYNTSYTSVAVNDNFPLKRGSRGTRVMMLQQAFAKATPGIMVDGQFGPQTAGALKKAGYPEVVDQALFNKITGTNNGVLQVVFNPGAIAVDLYKAAQGKNLGGVTLMLRQIKSVSDYSSVNEYYKKQSFISRTIVTDLLDYAFKNEQAAKEQIKNEFLRIGLKVNSSGTWSLQGIRLYKDLITIRETVVTDSKNNKIPVRRNTILGDEMEEANGMTWFRSVDNSILKVPSQDVKYT